MTPARFPHFTDDDYSTLGGRIIAEPTGQEQQVADGIRWFIEHADETPWPAERYRTAAIALTILATRKAEQP